MNKDGDTQFNVLICLENEQICKALHQFFTQEGATRVVYAQNNRVATQKMAENSFRYFIVDSELPTLGGIDFCRFIRIGDGEMAEAPIIMFMNNPSRKKVLDAINAGVHEIIVPPFTVDALKKRMKHIASHPRPFVRTDSYSGPVRAGTDDMNYVA